MTERQVNLNDETRQEYFAPNYCSFTFETSDLILKSPPVLPVDGELSDDESTLDPNDF